MPTVTLNKTVVEQLVGKELPLEELKDRISMLGTDLERIEGDEIEVEIFPNRPDLLSEQGFARAFSSFMGVKTGLQEYTVKESGDAVIIDPSVTMRPYTACAIIRNITFDDERIRELMQMQEKLATTFGRNRRKSAYGIYPLNNVTFPITYIAKDPNDVMFHPLGFETPIQASLVADQHPTGPKYKHIAEGWEKYPFFIDAKGNVMSMLPFTNSHDTGKVDESTTEVFVECSGTDLQNVLTALNMFVTMFADMGADIYSLEMKYEDETMITPDLTPKRMNIDVTYVNKLLGLKLKESDMEQLLAKMGFGYENGEALIPSYRADILHPVDFVEDIAIAYGYENFTEEIPNVSTIGEEDGLQKFLTKIREILIGYQLLEAKNYHLTTADNLTTKMQVEDDDVISLQNALGDHNHLRSSVIPSLLQNLAVNQHYEYPQNIFEIGRTFSKGQSETGIIEKEKLAVVMCHEKTDFTEARQLVEGLFSSLGMEVTVKEAEHPLYIEGRVGELQLNGTTIGMIGEFHPQVLVNWELMVPVVGFEIDIEEVFSVL